MGHSTRIKICGITSREDAIMAAGLGAWALGFIFYKESPRFISPYKAKKIIQDLPPFVTPVGVFVNQKEGAVKDIADLCGIRTLQFHGYESADYCRRFSKFKVIKAFRVKEDFNISGLGAYAVSAFLFDAHEPKVYGGSGKTFNWDIIKDKNFTKPVILSGGLNAENVCEAIKAVGPFAVDVSSGVEESPGKKKFKLIQDFVEQVQEAQ